MRVTQPADVTIASVPDGAAGLFITDPPWDLAGGGMFAAAARYDRLPVRGCVRVLADARRALAPGAHLYCFAPSGPEFAEALQAFLEDGWLFLRVLAWDRDWKWGLGAYRTSWEPVLLLANGGPPRGIAELPVYPSLLRARSVGKRTAKPWQLYKAFMEKSSAPGELVVDPFCGTNPLETAAGYVDRRWLAGDVLPPAGVQASLEESRWHEAAGWGNGTGARRAGRRAPGEAPLFAPERAP